MFDWLFEGRTSVYAVLAALTVFLLLVWWQTRKRWLLFVAIGAAGTMGVYALLDRMVETDREQIVRRIKSMIASVNSGNLDGIFVNISDEFRSAGGKGKAELREMARNYIEQHIVTSVDVWDIVCIGEPSREERTAQAAFQVKVHGQPGVEGFLAECEATFDFDPRHGWRMRSVRLFKPQTTEEWQFQL